MNLIESIPHPSRINDIRFCARSTTSSAPFADEESEVLLVADAEGKIAAYELVDAPESPAANGNGESATKAKSTKAPKKSPAEDEMLDDDDDDESEDDEDDTPRYRMIAEFVGHENRLVLSHFSRHPYVSSTSVFTY